MENRILNLGIMAHVDAGETTLTVVKKALRQSSVIVMEPFLRYHLLAPSGCEKRLMAKLSKLQASIENIIWHDCEMEVQAVILNKNMDTIYIFGRFIKYALTICA